MCISRGPDAFFHFFLPSGEHTPFTQSASKMSRHFIADERRAATNSANGKKSGGRFG
jgi:hypothetical protein